MTFNSEKDFETHTSNLITTKVLPLDQDLLMIHTKKAVDILLCRYGKRPALYFIEIKYNKTNQGRSGTGHGRVGGIQLKY